MVETPVLYITFARPEYASQSFAAIKKHNLRNCTFIVIRLVLIDQMRSPETRKLDLMLSKLTGIVK